MGKSLAARLHDFNKEYNYYEYCDNFVGPTEEDEIAALDLQLRNEDSAMDLLNGLIKIKEKADLSADQTATLDDLINDVGLQTAETEVAPDENIELGML